jgi:predicted DNA-binding transcriptional regulator YafY
MPKNVKRITRLLRLLQTLQSGNGQNADGLAANCGVSRRTVFRDLEALKSAGVPLEYDAEHDRYSIPSAFFLPPVNFTAAEALALLALSSEMGRGDRLPFYEPAQAAALKLAGSLPGALREELRDMTRAIRIQPSPVSPLQGKRGIYQQLVDARAARRVCRIEYDSLTEWERITTKLRPYYLLFCRHSWYVIGRSSLHAEVRTFNLSRIASLEILPETFNVPKGFSVERHLRNAWMLIPDDGPDQIVEIRFQPLVAQNVAEVLWHKTQELKFEPDGALLYRVCVSGLGEIVWWVLGYGDQAEVLRPAKLRHLVAQRAKAMAAIYNGEDN